MAVSFCAPPPPSHRACSRSVISKKLTAVQLARMAVVPLLLGNIWKPTQLTGEFLQMAADGMTCLGLESGIAEIMSTVAMNLTFPAWVPGAVQATSLSEKTDLTRQLLEHAADDLAVSPLLLYGTL